ncbi:MAG TPA: glycosyltransferase family 87 protein [Candidatus Limnocylindria bacterium]|jgi:hypothetical protein|nr:glycosyltransferase family 87 protein [Candidatus Limnocylindria bacterium]
MRSGAAERPRWVWAIGSAIFVLAALSALQIFLTKQPYGTDLWAYVLAGRHLLAGEPLYPPDPVVPFGPFGEYHYPPATALPFMLLAPLPFWLATAITIGLNVGIAAAIGVHLIRPLARDIQPWAAAGYVLFLPTTLEITLGQLNLVTVGLCLVAWSLRRRPVLAGIVLAIAIGVKLLPATLVLFYLASGRTRLVVTTAITGAAGLLLTWILFPHDLPAYIGILGDIRASNWAADYLASGSPASLAALVGSAIATAALPAAALASAIGGGLLARRDDRHETHLHHLALAFAPYVASFSLIWFTYLVTALPALATTLQLAMRAPRRGLRAGLVAGLALSWLLLQVVGESNDIVPIAAHLLGLLLLFVLGILVLVFARAPEPSAAVSRAVV